MNWKRMLMFAFLAGALLVTSACVYIVLPEGLEEAEEAQGASIKDWSALVTGVSQTDNGDLQIDITIRNDTGQWSTMQAVADRPATLASGDGKKSTCQTVFVGTGGHRLAPGFQMRGYTTGAVEQPEVQMLHVICEGASAAAGATLAIDYVSFNGILDDYDPEANKAEGTLTLSLDEVAGDLAYPIAAPVDGLIQEASIEITALSDNIVTLIDAQRTESGFEFTWQNFNPTKFPLKTHIGTPPVIGADGILYGIYETLDMAPVPITPANENMQWATQVSVPQDVKGFYILLSVESKKPRTYIPYVLDISDR
ncbi:MAG: hypothetical protein ACOYYS_14550 [Chloroflexota bacterium]